ncbi:DUF924 family protein [Xanthobacter sp. TB0136]|uniref:DUF924 family protein n=1 Tax=Xanthobacter sp. TB0136 TaxID=3459177 RepID=UPI0040398B7F
MQHDAAGILDFWRKAGPDKWFGGGPAFDDEVRQHLLPAYEQAVDRLLDHWQKDAESALARLILLDQVPRNIFRGSPRAFATDALARAGAEEAIAKGFDRAPEVERAPTLRGFFYLPLMHAEDVEAQARCVALYREWGEENGLSYALVHQDIIVRFGRFPHRNLILGRTMTPDEQAYLDAGGFSG